MFNPEPDSKAASLSQVGLVMGNEVKGEGRASTQTANLIKVNAREKKRIHRQGVEIHFNSTWVCLRRQSFFSLPYTYIKNTSKAMYRLLDFKYKNNNYHVKDNQTITKLNYTL